MDKSKISKNYPHSKIAEKIYERAMFIPQKAVEKIAKEHEAQLVKDLKAMKKEVGLSLNFGSKPQIKRKILAKKISENLINQRNLRH